MGLLLFLFLQACTTVQPVPSHPPGRTELPPPALPGQPKPYRVYGAWYHPLTNASGFEEQGIASWYGEEFHGRKTSNGEIYDMYAMTAAHKTLPLGTYVRVHNLSNNRSVDVRINDRGPFVRGRIIDLSYTAAKELGVLGPGTAPVKVVALGAPAEPQAPGQPAGYRPVDYYSGNFTFQVGAFAEIANAERLVQKLNQQFENAHMVTYSDGTRTFYRVRVGRSTNLDQAVQYERTLSENGYPGVFIVAE
ncbi:MAG: septal ring lytic transglycosylase RlpA family protein [Desulfobacteraceae bacterium]|nr:MAG: septal ring lytic transglycosylase RlpA family protein [Desulfobacteraceae bacterium]